MNRKQYKAALSRRRRTVGYNFEPSSLRIAPIDSVLTNTNIVSDLNSLLDSQSPVSISGGDTETIRLKLPPTPQGGIFTFEVDSQDQQDPWICTGEYSTDSTDGVNGNWITIVMPVLFRGFQLKNHLQNIELPVSQDSYWFKATFNNTDSISWSLYNVGIRHYSATFIDDIWVLFGDSLTEGNIKHEMINSMGRSSYGQDPLIFNRGFSGKKVDWVDSIVDNVMLSLPRVRFIWLHIGINDVSFARYYSTAGSEKLNTIEGHYRSICNKILNSNKVPLLTRIGFANYPNEPNVISGVHNGSLPDHGSLPFNINIIDPIIKELTPKLYNFNTDKPYIDLYNYELNNQQFMAYDGVHFTADGPGFWVTMIEIMAMRLIYNNLKPATVIPEVFETPIEEAENAVALVEATLLADDKVSAQSAVTFLSDWLLMYSQVQIDNLQARVDAIETVIPEEPVKYLIDIGPTLTSGNWNGITDLAQGLTSLSDSLGNSSTLSFLMTNAFGSTDANGGMVIAGSNIPGAIMQDSFQLQSWVSDPSFEIGGLDPSKTYTFDFYSSQDDASGYQTRFTIGGVSQDVLTSGNTTETVKFLNLVPNESNKISVSISIPSGSYGFLNALIISIN
jgi:lysophospholipase L1-like esterase